MSAYSFPTMSSSAIIESISQIWEVDIDVSSLAKPTPALVGELYARAIEYLSGVRVEDIEAAHTRIMAMDEPMDICSDAVSQQILFYHLQRVCRVAKFDDVRLSDLYEPDPDRTIKILSALMNVCQFVIERSEFFARLRNQSELARNEYDTVAKELEDMRFKVAAAKAARKKEEPLVRELEQEAGALLAQLEAANKEHIVAVNETAINKQERSALTERLKALREERQVAFDTNAALRAQIVEEPERLRFIITEMGRQAVQHRQNISDNEAKARELRNKSERAVAYEQDIRAATQVLLKVEEQQLALADATEKLSELKMDYEQAKIEKNELDMKHARTIRKLENAQTRLKDATETAHRKREASEKAIARLRQEYAQMSSERKENDADVEETKKQIEDVERQMAVHLRENEAQINDMLHEYARLRHQVDVYMEMLGREIGFQADL